jgi:hypothetical protein
MERLTSPQLNTNLTTEQTFQQRLKKFEKQKACVEHVRAAPATCYSLTWSREHPPMGDGIEAVSISSGQRCAWNNKYL